ncbi:hypothetical protein Dda_4532 [Drechslerella dactyloides]|uniref:Uncharacterized protein n=1 Tax=Drechslerella dactyloides TaxID=74499 RepID=A0AAD6J1G7_DREDA|nr:hypothetical protein Dda_4532 [Drechslerella dactyloides]
MPAEEAVAAAAAARDVAAVPAAMLRWVAIVMVEDACDGMEREGGWRESVAEGGSGARDERKKQAAK